MIQVLIPFGGEDPHRAAARDWVAARYAQRFEVTIAEMSGPWSKGAAVNPALDASTADIIIAADADSFVDEQHLDRAILHAEVHGWAMPHSIVKRFDRSSTADILAGRPGRRRLERGSYPALPGGGIVVATKQAWSTVRGFDPRFVGWGGEDHALGLAFGALVAPVNTRRHAALCHLWHPPHPHCRKPSQANRDLDARYRKARRNPDLMADLVGEW